MVPELKVCTGMPSFEILWKRSKLWIGVARTRGKGYRAAAKCLCNMCKPLNFIPATINTEIFRISQSAPLGRILDFFVWRGWAHDGLTTRARLPHSLPHTQLRRTQVTFRESLFCFIWLFEKGTRYTVKTGLEHLTDPIFHLLFTF